MSNELCLCGRGHFTEPETCTVWLKMSISNSPGQYSFVVASVGFNINRVTIQHTPKCVENCSDSKVLYNYLSNFTRFSVTLVITRKQRFSQRGLNIWL